MKIRSIWQQIPKQLAKENKKFVFSAIRKSARGHQYEEAIQWLIDARIIHKNVNVSVPKLPLSAYSDHKGFKLFMGDIGLLGAMSGLSAKALLESNRMFMEYHGALTENYVTQELFAAGWENLFYWTSSGTAEVDFLLAKDTTIYPLEVKADNVTKSKSLQSYANKYKTNLLSRSSTLNLKHDGHIINYPLYLISRFPITET